MQIQAMFEGGESTNDCRVMYDTKHTVRDLRNSTGFVLRDAEDRVFETWRLLKFRWGFF